MDSLIDFAVKPERIDGIANGEIRSGNSLDNLVGQIQGTIDSFDYSPSSLVETEPILKLKHIDLEGDLSLKNKILFVELQKNSIPKNPLEKLIFLSILQMVSF